MVKSSSFFLLFIIVCYFTWIAEVKSMENALVFDAVSQKLLEINDNFKQCSSVCLFACPAYEKNEKLIDKYGSISGTGVYTPSIRVVDSKPAGKNELETNLQVCQERYEPVMIHDKVTKSYYSGYELYYYNDEETFTLISEKYENLEKFTFREENKEKSQDLNKNLVSKKEKKENNENTVFEVYDDNISEWTFFWIPVLSIQVSGQIRLISFTKDQINSHHQLNRTMFMCKDYSLEDHSYHMPSQKWINYQESLSKHPKDKKKKFLGGEENNPKQTEALLEAIQIMPMRFFHTLSARLATCTYLNLAYVAKNISVDVLEEVDLFLYSMYREWPSQIDIIFGATGELKENYSKELEIITKSGDERLQKFPIPKPEILYRIIQYTANNQPRNAIVITHTTFGLVSDEEIICSSIAQLKGWRGLMQSKVHPGFNYPSGLTYACPVTLDTIQRLGIKYDKIWPALELNEDQQKKIMKQRESVILEENYA